MGSRVCSYIEGVIVPFSQERIKKEWCNISCYGSCKITLFLCASLIFFVK